MIATRRTTLRSKYAAACAVCAVYAGALLSACSVGPNFVRPTPQVPPQWSAQALAPPSIEETPAEAVAPADTHAASRVVGETQAAEDWWKEFHDPTLDSLIERARGANLDLRTAVLRVEESRSQRSITGAAYWPSLSANAGVSRERISETTPQGSLLGTVGSFHAPGGPSLSIPNPYTQYQLGADVSWEFDLFGRLRRSMEVANANLNSSIEDQRGVELTLLADVAQNYLTLRGAQQHLAVARDNLATVEELLDLTRQRRNAGLTTHIDVSNAIAQVTQTRAEIPTLELTVTQSINQLSELLGLPPEALRSELSSPATLPALPPQVPIGLPGDMARRRPDIREAEANLHGATAQIGVAVGDLFPRLTLTGSGGYQSETTGKLLEWTSRFGSIGPAVQLPVFDRGRWKTVELDKVRSREAALTYQRTVLNALHEVENAVATYGADQERRAWLESTVAQNQDAFGLMRQRYASGVATFLDVLNVERTLQSNRMALADVDTAVATDLVRLYRALGGGWQESADPVSP